MGRKRTLSVQENLIDKKRVKQFHSQPTNNNHEHNRKVGTIVRIVLKNFMCHSHLEVTFKNNINFIAGNNGAGKSAILTALVIGLGGKASTTQRGNNIKCLVKAGKTIATIEITILNSGPHAFKPSTYGDEITVIRTLNANGGGGYKVKDSMGHVISQSAKIVHQIVSFLNIQISNPVCVLNQDTARNFLLSNEPKQKFKFFIKASRLEELIEECVKLKSAYHNLKDIFEEKIKLSKEMNSEMKDCKQKIENHKNMLQLEDNYRKLAAEVTWAAIQEKEVEVQKQEDVVEEFQKVVQNYDNIMKNRAKLTEENREKLTELEQKINEIKETISMQSGPIKDIDQQLMKFRVMIKEMNLEKTRLLNMISRDEQNIQQLQENIKNYAKNLSQKEQEKQVRKKDIETHKEQIRLIQDTLETSQNELYQLKSSLSKIEQEENDLMQERRELQRQLDVIKDDIESLKMKSSNSLHLYGRNIPQIMDALNCNKHKFKKMPKGPLGVYIKIKDKKWSVAVEGFLANLLQSFTVDNTADNRCLSQIFNQYCQSSRPPTIITSKYFDVVHNVKPNLVRAPPDCVSLYDIIEVKDSVVMNCLIDQLGIENILLIPSSNRAIELLSERQNVPINCKQGITIKGDRFYPDPNYRSYCSTYHQARYLEVDKAEVIKHNEERFNQVKGKIASVLNQIHMVSVNKKQQQGLVCEVQPRQEQLKRKRDALRANLDRLQLADEPELTNNESLEDELKVLKEKIQEKNVRVETVDTKENSLKQDMGNLQDKKTNLLTNIRSLEERLPPLLTEINRLSDQQKEFNMSKNVENRRKQEAINNVTVARTNLDKMKSSVLRQIESAGGEEKRVQTKKKAKEIEDELKDVDKKLQQLNSLSVDIKEINVRYKLIREKYDQAMESLTAIENGKNKVSSSLRQRSKHYENTRDYFAHFINYNFQQVLEYRQFKGGVVINFEQETLELIVTPQHSSQGPTATTNLSGGERSFSTVAFLYAMWKVLSCPFYFLDEFDVFMDKLNRSKVIEILIQHARGKRDTQFVFLTPQDTSFIQEDDVSLHRLEDPERMNGNL
ncbi:structural maintenance of chromosomes protein 6 [Onthophagus taurus]|uniref:structural maintenance of chromosomes protein 6 n=1 Tax=Onthophagus taurus TaxID=166361 RepID=UPI000C20F236|nr:structural maintenance of chromosomes protein 6 [Onthophagus taurus]XP_022920757.1 structural maintenance of chromosomes protein 6 [Onthophagus taurus]